MSLVGHSPVETLLARALARGRVAHAYLFLGPTGTGKATAARHFARALNCAHQPAWREESRGDWRLEPCGRCDSCRRIAAGTHPEVIEVRPDSKTGQDISVDQAREIRRNAALTPKLGSRRVYLLPQAEALNEASANALLKTLEEPSGSVVMLLCAPNPSLVLPTIRSRCQTVRFGLVPPGPIAAALVERGLEPEQAEALARACGGRPGFAFSWMDDPEVLQRRRAVLDVFAEAVAAQPEANQCPALGILALRLAERLGRLLPGEEEQLSRGARPNKVLHSENLEMGLSLLRDLLMLTSGAEPALVQNQDRLPELRELAGRSDPTRLMQGIESVREAQQLLDRNVNAQLVLERMFWALIRHPWPLGERLFRRGAA